eukprot:TRINITY_DN11909_c0_g1_i1.p1 TRINITY_DN11909_c0_g1~~TRINITY_DN11909_c0_g1_i1.p1  ORF type:complete len:245 (+),score=64.72 TRINITY_DN11909_c0_g1_i1:242-976(+)
MSKAKQAQSSLEDICNEDDPFVDRENARIDKLIGDGADLNAPYVDGVSCMQVAISRGVVKRIESLLRHIDINAEHKSHGTLSHALGGQSRVRNEDHAARTIETAKMFGAHPKWNPNAQRSSDDATCFHLLAVEGSDEMTPIKIKIARELVKHPAVDLSLQDIEGKTALERAKENDQPGLVKLFTEVASKSSNKDGGATSSSSSGGGLMSNDVRDKLLVLVAKSLVIQGGSGTKEIKDLLKEAGL